MKKQDLIETIERYINEDLSEEEAIAFEELRKSDPEADILTKEYIKLFKELKHTAGRKSFEETLSLVHEKLEEEGFIEHKKNSRKAIIRSLWSHYKYSIAAAVVAASIVSFLLLSGTSLLTSGRKTSTLTPLVNNKLNQMENKLTEMEIKLKDVVPAKAAFEPLFMATGFLIDGKGYVITNAHVVENARNLIVENKNGKQYSAISLFSDENTDLAILKITDTSFRHIKALPYVFKKADSHLSEQIFTLGYPREEMVYNEGYLSALSGYYGDTSTYQINISVNPGNSGGPVIDKSGDVIGIISSKETDADGVVFAIKSDKVFEAASKLNEKRGDTITLPEKNTLKNLPRIRQVKNVEDYIFKVKGN